MKLLKSIKTATSICAQNLRKWRTDYRVWAIAGLLTILVLICVDEFRTVSEKLGSKMTIWIFPFLYTQYYARLIFTMPIILLFCNAPFIDGNQTFVYLRTGRKKWLGGQVLYIVAASAIYYLFLVIVSILFTILFGGGVEFGREWGETILTMGNSNTAYYFGVHFLEVPNLISNFFTPLEAMWFTFVTSWCSAVLLGLIMFFCNLLTGTKALGITLSSLLVVICFIVDSASWYKLLPYSPISWNTVDNIDIGGMTAFPSFTYCMTVYSILFVILTAGIFIFGSKKSLDIKEV